MSKKKLFEGLLDDIAKKTQNPMNTGTQESIKKEIQKEVNTENNKPVSTEIQEPVKKVNSKTKNTGNRKDGNTVIQEPVEKKTFDFPASLASRLKIASALTDKYEREIVIEAVMDYLNELGIPDPGKIAIKSKRK